MLTSSRKNALLQCAPNQSSRGHESRGSPQRPQTRSSRRNEEKTISTRTTRSRDRRQAQHHQSSEEEENYETLKSKNGANKRRRMDNGAQSFVALQKEAEPEVSHESLTSSQNTQEQTNAAGVLAPAASMHKAETIDLSLYTRAMIDEGKGRESAAILFSRKPLLQISKLRKTVHHGSAHLQQNKLSDKMGRRDIQFYDLYKLDKQKTDVEKLLDKGYVQEGVLKGTHVDPKTGKESEIDEDREPIYGDIEVEDFNKLFRNQNLIRDRFGQSISVSLKVGTDQCVTRTVKEHLDKVVEQKTDAVSMLELDDPNEMSCIYSQAGQLFDENLGEEVPSEFTQQTLENVDNVTLAKQLKLICEDFKKSNKEVSEVWTMVNGDTGKVRKYFNNEKVVTWSPLEDLALTEPDTSVEFQVLLQEKGWKEISERRNFLKAKPIFEEKIYLTGNAQ